MPVPESFAPFIPWARLALTGKPLTPLANDDEFKETVAFVGPSAFAELLTLMPESCKPTFGVFEEKADVDAFNQAMGAKIASYFLSSPAGTDYYDNITKVTTAGVTETFSVPTLDVLIGRCESSAEKAIQRLSCVVDAAKQSGTVSLVGLVGRPRSPRYPYGASHGRRERRY